MDPDASTTDDAGFRSVLDPDVLDPDALAERVAERVADLLGSRLDSVTPALLDIRGVADRLQVSQRTVESLVALGEIPVTRIGTGRGVRRFDPDALEAFVRRQTRVL